MGEYFKAKLIKLPHVIDARGRGLLVGCEYDIPIALDVKWECFKNRLLITAIGDNTNRMIPPLILEKSHIDCAVKIMESAIIEAVKKYEEGQRKSA